jgi:hypothetical protein
VPGRSSSQADVDGQAGLDIYQHGAVDVSFAQREVVQDQHPRGRDDRGIGQDPDQPQQRHPAHRGR